MKIVVNLSNSPSWEDAAVLEFFQKSTGNLLAAAKANDVKHYVALSVVGTERLQASGYFVAKQAQEELIKNSGVPYTIRDRESGDTHLYQSLNVGLHRCFKGRPEIPPSHRRRQRRSHPFALPI